MEDLQTFSFSFGELLKTARKQKHLTQKQLARLLGVHANTISNWELGSYLPDTYGLVLELARHLALEEQETRQLLEASLTALSPHWGVPFPRNPLFTRRQEILEALHMYLGVDQVVALTQSYALQGLGGIGKTQIALEYVYRHALEYSAVLWIEAGTAENIMSSLLHIAEPLQLPQWQEADQQRIRAAVQHWLSTHSHWLLIWDNLEDLSLLHRMLPPTHQGAILLTTPCQALGILAQGLELSPMGREEGMLLVLRRAKVLDLEASSEHSHQLAERMPIEYAAASELVRVMDGLPLALDQASAYIEEMGCNFSDYLRQYEQQHHQFLARRGELSGNHPHSVMATLWLACQRVGQQHPGALELLRCCAFLSADAIPEELFEAGAGQLGPASADPFQLDQVIAALRAFSLIQRYPEIRMFSIHPLVQTVLREKMSERERVQRQRRAIHILNVLFPEVTSEITSEEWRKCERLLPHVLTAVSTLPNQAENQESADLQRKSAKYLHERALHI